MQLRCTANFCESQPALSYSYLTDTNSINLSGSKLPWVLQTHNFHILLPSPICYTWAFSFCECTLLYKWSVQAYIHTCAIIVIASVVIVLAWLRLKEERSQKIDNLPGLATCRSVTSVILCSSQLSHCSKKHSIMPDMAHGGF